MTGEDFDYRRTTFRPQDSHDPLSLATEPLGHYLVCIDALPTPERFEIGEAPVTIGRNAEQSIVFAGDQNVSRVHAKVSLVDGCVVVEDLGSTNGTFVDGKRLLEPTCLREGDVVRIGSRLLKYERLSRSAAERTEEFNRSVLEAAKYVESLLPPPIDSGTVCVDWCFVPSTHLGGDGFGYFWVDRDTFVFYLIDVSGHGVGPALHSAAVLNVLRQRALPGVDFASPADVLSRLNDRFQMADHGGMLFTMWYGSYQMGARRLTYSSAGHHPAYLVTPNARNARTAQPLARRALMIGAAPNQRYDVDETALTGGSALYLFSDGAFELTTSDQRRWGLADLVALVTDPPGDVWSADRLYRAVRQIARPGALEDDLTLMVVTFPS